MSIAIISAACRFPDAASPAELWANLVEGRRSFREISPQRLDIARYAADVIGEADSITRIRAGLLTNWSFPRSAFRIPEKTFAATDLTHWLALELAADAIARIGGPDRLDRSRTAVIVANTLTGEFSRASLLRLRLPFLTNILTKAGDAEGLPPQALARMHQRFAALLREPFDDPNEDSLAGGLANTIAGRIANHFDLRGGAYAVDGACASSLVALADAANLLMAGQAEAVIAVAVDLSLDPFELVGFSRNGALAPDEMRVFDARASGFWPGEGGACVVLMRNGEAHRCELPALAQIRGWGLSTDGAGGLTRPSSEGQLSAASRACAKAGVDPADLAFIEAHGTGTAVGDPIEVRALAALRSGAHAPLPIGSIKANIGHTKAAAGFAGLLKSIEALRHDFFPPHAGCTHPHPVFAELEGAIYPELMGCALPEQRALIAGVSSFGFGGINAHVVLEKAATTAAARCSPAFRPPRPQDAELFLFAGDDAAGIDRVIAGWQERAATLSMAELADAAAHAAAMLHHGPFRLAIVASSGSELADRLAAARRRLQAHHCADDGVSFGQATVPPRIGLLFPGQAAPSRPDGGLWGRRFPDLADLLGRLPKSPGASTATELAQPTIVAASLAALRFLKRLGVLADIGAGHSLGEISALAWSGALQHEAALELATVRGRIMAAHATKGGTMLRVALSAENALLLLRDCGLVIACRNGPTETVLAGTAAALGEALTRCAANRIDATPLAVSHAFHSPDMRGAVQPLTVALDAFSFGPAAGNVVSTIRGRRLGRDEDLKRLLVDQLEAPVLFDDALSELAANADLLIEAGPGQGLSRLARARGLIAMPMDAFGDSIVPLLDCVAGLFTAGAALRIEALFEGRSIRRFEPAEIPAFIESPCGRREEVHTLAVAPPVIIDDGGATTPPGSDPLDVVTMVVARETGLDPVSFSRDDRFLDQLHLNSLAVSRIVRKAAVALGVRAPSVPTEFANATARQLADALDELRNCERPGAARQQRVAGVRRWVRTFAMGWEISPLPPETADAPRWSELTIGPNAPSDRQPENCEGLLIWIENPFAAEHAASLVALVAEAARSGVAHLALCHNGRPPIAAFARSVAQESHFRSVRVIDRSGAGKNDARIAAVLAATGGPYFEARLSKQGGIETPVFAPATAASSPAAAITAGDVMVVIGGGKGIAAECALRLAERGTAVILVGRSTEHDPEVAATLARARQKELRCAYVSADVLDSGLAEKLWPVTARFGAATVLVYAAGTNDPKRLTELDDRAVQATLALKTTGLNAALDALGPQLRHLITFGSIIGRLGLEGEAHYALANGLQTAATESWAAAAPNRSALAIEWSLWGGVGMGERLGTVERLEGKGVDALTVDQALDCFERLITEAAIGTVVVTSRFGPPPFLRIGAGQLPLLRFVDEPKLHFPNVEIVIETELSQGRDLYLSDHVIAGRRVLPGVIGLEAMAQVTSVVMPLEDRISITDVAFARAVDVGESGIRIRIAALRTGGSTTEAVLYAADDHFTAPCMRATFTNADVSPVSVQAAAPEYAFVAEPLYGPLFFGGERFRRVKQLKLASSRRINAELRCQSEPKWFGSYEPQNCVLWDPGSADAALHVLQAAVPHKRVLPVMIERIDVDRTTETPCGVRAVEWRGSADCYVFDIALVDAKGRSCCRWTHAAFRTVAHVDIRAVLAAAPQLARSYLERVARETLGDDTIEIALIEEPGLSREARRRASLHELGVNAPVLRRGDGRPMRSDGRGIISIAHGSHLTLAAVSDTAIGCDLEPLGPTPADAEDIWRHVAAEAIRKLGHRPDITALRGVKLGVAMRTEGIELVVLDIVTASGRHALGFARDRHTAPCLVLPAVSEAI
ncbi:enediyne polyketide synthase [Bradyrhizobium japonicum]